MILVKFDEKQAGGVLFSQMLTSLPGYVSEYRQDGDKVEVEELEAIAEWLCEAPVPRVREGHRAPSA